MLAACTPPSPMSKNRPAACPAACSWSGQAGFAPPARAASGSPTTPPAGKAAGKTAAAKSRAGKARNADLTGFRSIETQNSGRL